LSLGSWEKLYPGELLYESIFCQEVPKIAPLPEFSCFAAAFGRWLPSPIVPAAYHTGGRHKLPPAPGQWSDGFSYGLKPCDPNGVLTFD